MRDVIAFDQTQELIVRSERKVEWNISKSRSFVFNKIRFDQALQQGQQRQIMDRIDAVNGEQQNGWRRSRIKKIPAQDQERQSFLGL